MNLNSLYNAVASVITQGTEGAAWLKTQGAQKISKILDSLSPEQRKVVEMLFESPAGPRALQQMDRENKMLKSDIAQLKTTDQAAFETITQITQQALSLAVPQKGDLQKSALKEQIEHITSVADEAKARILGYSTEEEATEDEDLYIRDVVRLEAEMHELVRAQLENLSAEVKRLQNENAQLRKEKSWFPFNWHRST